MTQTTDPSNQIAIVGMAGRFPGATNVQEFWENIRNGIESISKFDDHLLRQHGCNDELLNDPSYVKAGGVLRDIEMFDAELFEFSPREAEVTDPQHRILLEIAWEALENAAYDPRQYRERIGVYAGLGPSRYLMHNLMSRPDILQSVGEVPLFLGNNKDFAPTRICYKLDLRGPGISVNTACSSSLVATHMACQALLDYHCDMALAGGAGIQVPQVQGYLHQEGGIGSPDGKCRAFDASAGGTVTGNGAGLVVLKRLEDALADNDFIHAVILGSAVNNDGADKVGYTAPSVSGQSDVIAEALAVADVPSDTIGLVEAHGTGTRLGDPIEVAALNAAFGDGATRCAIGSVKTNIGHIDEGAGIAGLIKASMSVREGERPPSLHYKQPNPEIDLGRFFVNAELSSWPDQDHPRRAGVSSFGIGGTNAHIILEQPPDQAFQTDAQARPALLTLSAKSPRALGQLAGKIASHLESTDDAFQDVCYSLAVGRQPLEYRRAMQCQNAKHAVDWLRPISESNSIDPLTDSECPVAFLFPGQGLAYSQQGRQLYERESVFRDSIDLCSQVIQQASADKIDLATTLFGSSQEPLHRSNLIQPALFAWQYSMAQLWLGWGLQPSVLLGHSLGQYVAATVAGVFTVEDAVKLVMARGNLIRQMPTGSMLAVNLCESDLRSHFKLLGTRTLDIAAVNAPEITVATGPTNEIMALEQSLGSSGRFCKRLETTHAFHSRMLESAGQQFESLVEQVQLSPPQIPLLSNVTGTWMTDSEATSPKHWARHLLETVRFSKNLAELQSRGEFQILNIGPGKSMSTLLRQNQIDDKDCVDASQGNPDNQSDLETIVSAVGELWERGASISWSDFFQDQSRRRVPLPTYPFQRKRYWVEATPQRSANRDKSDAKPEAIAAAHVRESQGVPDDHDYESWLRVPQWQQVALSNSERLGSERVVLFHDNMGCSNALADQLRQLGCEIVHASPGQTYQQHATDRYTISPSDPSSYRQLWETLREANKFPSRIIHAWNIGDRHPSLGDDPGCFLGLLALIQQCVALTPERNLSIDVLSTNVHRIESGDTVLAEKSLLLGPVRVAPLEHTNLTCRSIDVDDIRDGKWEQTTERLLLELSENDEVVALRAGHRFIPKLKRVPSGPQLSPLRDRGVYLITGGLGSMGKAFARYLSEKVNARLALVHRPRTQAAESSHISHQSPLLEALKVSAKESLDASTTQLIGRTPKLESLLNELCASLVGDYLDEAVENWQTGCKFSIDQLLRDAGVLPEFEKMFRRMVGWLGSDGLLQKIGDGATTRLTTTVRRKLSATVADEIQEQYPAFKGLVKLLVHCASHYRAALSGATESISVLYPDGTPKFLDECLEQSADCTNDSMYLDLAANYVSELAPSSQRPDDNVNHRARPLKILEIGGGTGTLTRHVIEKLGERDTADVEYWFTDLGHSFVLQAERDAVAHNIEFMRFGQYDITRSPDEQSFAERDFDIIIGYNVAHVAANMRQCADRLGRLLVPGGQLLLVETVQQRRWQDMIWGLAPAWWNFTDDNVRNGGPLLPLDRWEDVFRQPLFSTAVALPMDQSDRETTESGLIVAHRSDHLAAHSDLSEIPSDDLLLISTDVTKHDQMESAVNQTLDRFGTIHGVIHAAGVLGQGLLRNKTAQECRAVVLPKVDAARHLEQLLASEELDLFVNCSSLASTQPIAGQIDYCAANAFLDGFAYQTTRIKTCLTIDWGFWQELGMIAKSDMSSEDKLEIERQIQAKGWSSAGIALFDRILASVSGGQVLVSPDFEQPEQSLLNDQPWYSDYEQGPDGTLAFSARLSPQTHWVLREHRVASSLSGLGDEQVPTLPGTAFLDMVWTAMNCLSKVTPNDACGAMRLKDVFFLDPLTIEEQSSREVKCLLVPMSQGYRFHVVSHAESDQWHEHVRGEVRRSDSPPRNDSPDATGQATFRKLRENLISVANSDHEFARRVGAYPGRWRNVDGFALSESWGCVQLDLPDEFRVETEAHGLHPAILDLATGFLAHRSDMEHWLPFAYEHVEILRPLPSRLLSYAKEVTCEQPGMRRYDVRAYDMQGDCLFRVDGFTMRELEVLTDETTELSPSEAKPSTAENFIVEIHSPGHLQSLTFTETARKQLGEDEVEIEVVTAGLNFIEVLYALGMLPTPDGWEIQFGLECAGRIARVGANVKDFVVGDEVLALTSGSFSRFAYACSHCVAHKPKHLDWTDAATMPAAYATAWHGLVEKAQLRRNERVLVHSATGGVGLAAVNVARHVGAELYATAGNEEKRQYLRELGLHNISDSRSLEFADRVMEQSGGEGVDVVLNSLGGEFIDRGLSVLCRHGRFVELGKRDILRDAPLPLHHFEKHLSFLAVDMGPDLPHFSELWESVTERIQNGDFQPLPSRVFPLSKLADAIEYMASAKHIGKVILQIDPTHVQPRPAANRPFKRTQRLREIIGVDESGLGEREIVGQIDTNERLASAGHARPPLKTAYLPPRNATESKLTEIWQSLLGIDQVGVDDNFFDLRGDSLLAAQLVSRIQQSMGKTLSISAVLKATTIAQQAEQLSGQDLRQDSLSVSPISTDSLGHDFSSEHEEGEI